MAFWATVVVVAALVAYPLSYGPVLVVLARIGWYGMHSVAVSFYLPLEWIASQTEFTDDLLHWWFMLWVDLIPGG